MPIVARLVEPKFTAASDSNFVYTKCIYWQTNQARSHLIPPETANNFTHSLLVLVYMTDSRQLQQIKEVASQVVSILQYLSC